MPENNQYPQRDHDTKKPVTLVLLIVVIATVTLLVYRMWGAVPLPSTLVPPSTNHAPAPPVTGS